MRPPKPDPAVSVITPFLNASRFMNEAIRSVFDQTFAQWELILIDDGSTDESTSLARDYASRFPDQVILLHHEGHINRGASTSRNLGIELARGRYIAFLDADDVYLPEKLERQVALLDAHPEVGALYGSTEYWHSWTGLPEDQDRDYVALPDIPTERVYAPPSLINLIYVQKSAAVPCTCSLLVRRDLIVRTGGFEQAFRYLYTDQVFYTKLLSATPVYVMSDCLDRYRQHDDSNCYVAKRTGERQDLELTFMSWQVEYLSNQENVPKEYLRALRRAIRQMRYPLFSKIARRSRDSVRWLLESPAS